MRIGGSAKILPRHRGRRKHVLSLRPAFPLAPAGPPSHLGGINPEASYDDSDFRKVVLDPWRPADSEEVE